MSSPSSRTLPRSAASSPATMRNNVVLPQPDGPSRETNSPAAILRSTPPSTVMAPNAFSAPVTSRNESEATTRWLHRHVAVPTLYPVGAVVGDELPVDGEDGGVGRHAGRHRRFLVGRQREGGGRKLGLH